MKEDKNSISGKCKFCNGNLYYRGYPKHREEREVIVRDPLNNKFKKFYVHLKCWKAGLALIGGEVLDEIFLGYKKERKGK